MIFSLLSSSRNPLDILIVLLLTLPAMMLALSLHETAHGYVAYKCGDPTAYNLGRLTLNPLKHLDPMGLVCLLIFGYGWANPVPINTRNFRDPKRGMALSALAGPASNLLLGLICAVVAGVVWGCYTYVAWTDFPEFGKTALSLLTSALLYSAEINFLYMAFNMIPVPPFDGSRILLAFLPTNIYFRIMQYERQIMFGVLIALLVLSRFGFSPFGWIASELTDLISYPIAQAVFKGLL